MNENAHEIFWMNHWQIHRQTWTKMPMKYLGWFIGEFIHEHEWNRPWKVIRLNEIIFLFYNLPWWFIGTNMNENTCEIFGMIHCRIHTQTWMKMVIKYFGWFIDEIVHERALCYIRFNGIIFLFYKLSWWFIGTNMNENAYEIFVVIHWRIHTRIWMKSYMKEHYVI